jgi:hypothetical protein
MAEEWNFITVSADDTLYPNYRVKYFTSVFVSLLKGVKTKTNSTETNQNLMKADVSQKQIE